MSKKDIKKIVLAYSGGLDTSIIIPWLKENYNNPEIIAMAADVGQGDELDGLEEKAIKTGASKLYIEDMVDEMVDDVIIPSMMMGAKYEDYLLGTAFARPIIAKHLVEIAKKEGADAIAHGCTGKGNDQVRFELAVKRLAPEMKIIAPWREWDIKGREEEIDYAEAHNVPLKISRETNYSKDKNLWHLSHEGLDLEDPANEPQYDKPGFLEMSVSPFQAPEEPAYVTVDFVKGVPVALDGEQMKASDIIRKLNKLGGENGIGLLDIVENRLVGMKDGPRGAGDDHPGQGHQAHEEQAGGGLCRSGVQRQVVLHPPGVPPGLRREDPGARYRPGEAEALQGQHHHRRRHLPREPVLREPGHLRGERLQPGRRHRLHQPLGPPRYRPGPPGAGEAEEVTFWSTYFF